MKTDGIPRRGTMRPPATLATAGGGIMLADRKDAAARPGADWRAQAAAGPLGRTLAGAARGVGIVAGFIQAWLKRRAEHRALLHLNDDMLKDIGISRCDVEREVRTRSFR